MSTVKQFAMNLDHPLSDGCVMGDVENVTSPSRGFTMTQSQWTAMRELASSVAGYFKAKKAGIVYSSHGDDEFNWTRRMYDALPKVVHEFGPGMATVDNDVFQKRDCYPDGLFEFDTRDRSAPGENPPAMLRLRFHDKYDLMDLIEWAVRELRSQNCSPMYAFSGKLKEVDE